MTTKQPKTQAGHEAADVLDIVLDRAPRLRAEGVSEIAIDGLTVKFASVSEQPSPSTGATEKESDDAEAPARGDAWSDPDLGLDFDPKPTPKPRKTKE